MKIIIPSRRRSSLLQDRALLLFPNAIVCVADSEKDDYFRVTKNLLVHPDEVSGIGPLRQWILDHVADEVVLQVDDDVSEVASMIGYRKRTIVHPNDVMRLVMVTAQCAIDAGVSAFCYAQSWDPKNFQPQKPVTFSFWGGGVVGFVGRKHRYDTALKLRADTDFFLQCLLKDRIIYQDRRYAFVHVRWQGEGGNTVNRSAERHAEEIAYLKRKWGKYLIVQQKKDGTKLTISVPR